jgi:hypothetical protein
VCDVNQVLSSEFVKLIVAIVLLMKVSSTMFRVDAAQVKLNVTCIMQEGGAGAHDFDLTEMAKTAVPATLYVIQNNLAYLAISNLDAVREAVLCLNNSVHKIWLERRRAFKKILNLSLIYRRLTK